MSGNQSGLASATILTASNVTNGCRPVETAAGDIAPMHAGNGQLASVTPKPPDDTDPVTLEELLPVANVTNGVLRSCDWCGNEYTALRPRSRYCTSYCRRQAWLERNPEKAAELNERSRRHWRSVVEARGGVWEDRA